MRKEVGHKSGTFVPFKIGVESRILMTYTPHFSELHLVAVGSKFQLSKFH